MNPPNPKFALVLLIPLLIPLLALSSCASLFIKSSITTLSAQTKLRPSQTSTLNQAAWFTTDIFSLPAASTPITLNLSKPPATPHLATIAVFLNGSLLLQDADYSTSSNPPSITLSTPRPSSPSWVQIRYLSTH